MPKLKLCVAMFVAMVLSLQAVTVDKEFSSVQVTGKYLNTVDVQLKFDDYRADFDVKHGRVKKIVLRLGRENVDTGNVERDEYIKTKVLHSTSKLTISNITSKTAKGKLFVNGVIRNVLFKVKSLKSVVDPSKPSQKLFAIQLSSTIRRKDFQLTGTDFDASLSPSLKLDLNFIAKL